MTPLDISLPPLYLGVLAPVLIVLAAAALGILIEAFASRHTRHFAQVVVSLVAVVSALAVLALRWNASRFRVAARGTVAVDGPTYFIWMLILIFGGLSLMIFAERKLYNGGTAFTPAASSVPGSQAERDAITAKVEHAEIFPLALFAMAGMMLFAASNDLLLLFVSLEVMSLPLYLLSGLARRRRLISQEAALKYFLLGSLSSAIMLFGIALIYGYSGGFNYDTISAAVLAGQQGNGLLLTGMAMIIIGVLFKIGAVPFHNWTPDVYTGAPTPVTGFMASCTKIAAVAALLRVLYVAFGGMIWTWQPIIAVVALLTMLVGSTVALAQTDIKRLLAYSSIAHAGFILTAVCGAAVGGGPAAAVSSVGAILFYLTAYGFATIGAFGVVTLIRAKGGEQTTLDGWKGIGRQNPLLGVIFVLFLLSFAGIPLTSGFIGKWAAFVAAWRGGFWWLVVVAVLVSLVTAFFYLRVVMVMFFQSPAESLHTAAEAEHGEGVAPRRAQGALPAATSQPESGATRVGATVSRDPEAAEVGRGSWLTWVPILVGAAATVVLGILPGPMLDLAAHASSFLR